LNIDSPTDPQRPAHTVLLAAGIPILEHLTALESLPAQGFRLHAAPAPVRGMGTFPVRAYAVVGSWARPFMPDLTRRALLALVVAGSIVDSVVAARSASI